MAGNPMNLGGKPLSEVYQQLTKTGIPDHDAAIIVSSWIFENLGRSNRTFSYRTAFPGLRPECVAKFARTFTHDDWVDGESVVQAEQSVGEDGFNTRFHRIEADLDGLAADVAEAFTCLAEMRRDIRLLLDELRMEINRINSDVFECCNRGGGGGESPRRVEYIDYGGEYVTTTKILDKTVNVFRTERGLTLLPAIEHVLIDPANDPRVVNAGTLGRFVEERDVRGRFPQKFTKDDLVHEFGNEVTNDGRTLEEVVDILPDGTEFGSVEDLLGDVAAREAAAIRTSGAGTAAIANALGLEAGGAETVAEAPVERFNAIPREGRAALAAAGIDTVGKLAEAGPDEITAALHEGGVEASAGDVGAWRASANTLRLTGIGLR